jgi:phage gp46-like protein
MLDALAIAGKIGFWSIFAIGAWTALTSAILYFRDRSGNSGRNSHWADNPRISSPDEPTKDAWWENLTDEDTEALGAMLHIMRRETKD